MEFGKVVADYTCSATPWTQMSCWKHCSICSGMATAHAFAWLGGKQKGWYPVCLGQCAVAKYVGPGPSNLAEVRMDTGSLPPPLRQWNATPEDVTFYFDHEGRPAVSPNSNEVGCTFAREVVQISFAYVQAGWTRFYISDAAANGWASPQSHPEILAHEAKPFAV